MTAFSGADIMVLLPYTPRGDALDRGYEDWLREVDNPFFNGVPGIVHYSNWRVASVIRGSATFSHFDYMRVDPARADEVWTNPDVIAFAANWTRQWGADPDSEDLSVNYQSYRLRRVAGGADHFSRSTVLGIGAGPVAGSQGDEVWQLDLCLVGRPIADRLVVRNDPVGIGAEWADTIVMGELIAAPA